MVGASKEGESMAGAYVYLFSQYFLVSFFLRGTRGGWVCYQHMTFFLFFLHGSCCCVLVSKLSLHFSNYLFFCLGAGLTGCEKEKRGVGRS